jgi:hypothetical protein
MSEHVPRRLFWDDVLNVRDLGGLELVGGGVTRPRSVVRSSILSRLTPSGVEEVLTFGIRTVLDLRDAAEHDIDPNPFLVKDYGHAGPAVRRLPLYSPGDPDWALLAGGRPGVLSAYREPLISVFRAIHEAPKGGIVIMCHAGRDRTGLATAILLTAVGVSEAQVLADDRLSDAFLTPLYKQWANAQPDDAARTRLLGTVDARPRWLPRIMTELEGYGGAERYLREGGLSIAGLRAARERLCDQ